MNQDTNHHKTVDVLDSGAYEIIRKRLLTQKEELSNKLQLLNQARKEVFDSKAFVLKANQRITTENTCVARGLTSIGNYCILGYNVHFGLRTDISLQDVFSIYLFENDQFTPQNLDLISNPDFIRDYQNLYKYYKNAIFSRFVKTENYLYMIFQSTQNAADIKAFKWLIKNGELHYQDDRSVQEVKDPNPFDFVWKKTTLEDRRLGKFPHISILDRVFIEAIHGDITFKIEDNTDTGKGIYAEKVSNLDQQLDDAEYFYADLGNLIAIKIKPYQEDFRAYIFNQRTKEVVNIPALLESGILLPDNQGIIFPNGYYLQNGTSKVFDTQFTDVNFVKKIASPNGEDLFFIFNQKQTNTYILFSYNIIQQVVETPIYCNGVTLFKDGSMVYFKTDENATRHHQVQIWETPYVKELKENPEKQTHPIYKVGNKQIVQAMAEVHEVLQLLIKEDSYEGLYEDILKKSNALLDSYFWIQDEDLKNLGAPLIQIKEVANTAIDEFVKVQEQRKTAHEKQDELGKEIEGLQFHVNTLQSSNLNQYVTLLSQTRELQGKLLEAKNIRYIAVDIIDVYTDEVQSINQKISQATVEFLVKDDALDVYVNQIEEVKGQVEAVVKTIEAKQVENNSNQISNDLELLIDILNSLKIEDPTQTTKIVERIAVLFSTINQIRAQLIKKVSQIRSQEAVSEFHAQITLLEQAVVNYLELSTTVEKSDEYYTKIIVQLEELESKFSDIDDFALKISDKRDEIIKAFNAKREQILEQLTKKATTLEQIALRVLKNIENKAQTFATRQEVLSFFASDLMIDKVRQTSKDLKDLQDISKAENLENLLKKAQEDALRVLRDKEDLYADGNQIIKLGEHKFTVNKQALSLTLVRKNNIFYYHLTGTSFYQEVKDAGFLDYQMVWDQTFNSENKDVYRSEYLAYQTFLAFKENPDLNAETFINQVLEKEYTSGYVKGVHNEDALQIFNQLQESYQSLGLLTYTANQRATAQLFWNCITTEVQEHFKAHISASAKMAKSFKLAKGKQAVIDKLEEAIKSNPNLQLLNLEETQSCSQFIYDTFAKYNGFIVQQSALDTKDQFLNFLKENNVLADFNLDIDSTQFTFQDKYLLALQWVESYLEQENLKINDAPEIAIQLIYSKQYVQSISGTNVIKIQGLKGSHSVIENDVYYITYHQFITKLNFYQNNVLPTFLNFQLLKTQLLKNKEEKLKFREFTPKVLTSFVRNKLINKVYFKLIGNNLAKQLGAAGQDKRTARMGMLLLLSPPGYGKTTLMEYIAQTMGLHFVKINGPTLGHSITGIDPVEAKTSGEREELKKVNLALEMADNVMLYLDDIQHLNPEFLQKFISLADGQRKMDGIFDGQSKTYDLRGKRFCIVMSGNPYTETGDKFQIPDMLANRADVYNLGDVIGDTQELFNLSLIENAAGDNPYLEKIASKSLQDFYSLLDYDSNKQEQLPSLEGNYTTQEIEQFLAVLKHVKQVQNLVIDVNKNYIKSAAMQDQYRTEPAFKMQGSYRNMSKLVAQIVPIMNTDEVNQLLLSHYESEAQTLTANAEANLLKLKELAGLQTLIEAERWQNIKDIFIKNNKHAGLDTNNKMIAQLLEFNDNLQGIIHAIQNIK